MSSERRARPEFLNVDLDIRSHTGIEQLLEPIAGSAIQLHKTRESVSLELIEDFASVEEAISRWLDLIETLPTPAREIWNRCESRSLNVGIKAGNEPHAACFAISSAAISRLAIQNLEIIFTVYAH